MSTKSTSTGTTGQGLFKRVDDAEVVISSKGLFYQVDLFVRGKAIFAEVSKNKFVRLLPNGTTSSPQHKWDEIHGRDAKVTKGQLNLVK